jgi:hypothetical protein
MKWEKSHGIATLFCSQVTRPTSSEASYKLFVSELYSSQKENYEKIFAAVQLRAKRASSHRFGIFVVLKFCSDLYSYSVF